MSCHVAPEEVSVWEQLSAKLEKGIRPKTSQQLLMLHRPAI